MKKIGIKTAGLAVCLLLGLLVGGCRENQVQPLRTEVQTAAQPGREETTEPGPSEPPAEEMAEETGPQTEAEQVLKAPQAEEPPAASRTQSPEPSAEAEEEQTEQTELQTEIRDQPVPLEDAPAAGQPEPPRPEQTEDAAESQPESDSPAARAETEQQIFQRYVDWLYARKEKLLEQAQLLKERAKQKAYEKPREEWGIGYLAWVAMGFVGEGYELVYECDRDVEAKLEQMEQELQSIGGDVSLAEQLQQAYQEQRESGIAGYLQQIRELA